jgi:hypothetical protein
MFVANVWRTSTPGFRSVLLVFIQQMAPKNQHQRMIRMMSVCLQNTSSVWKVCSLKERVPRLPQTVPPTEARPGASVHSSVMGQADHLAGGACIGLDVCRHASVGCPTGPWIAQRFLGGLGVANGEDRVAQSVSRRIAGAVCIGRINPGHRESVG